MDNTKRTLLPTIRYIKRWQEPLKVRLIKKGNPLDQLEATFERRVDKGFSVRFQSSDPFFGDLPNIDEVGVVDSEGVAWTIPSLLVNNWGIEVKAKVMRFGNPVFSETLEGYFRYLIPVSEEADYYHSIEDISIPIVDYGHVLAIKVDFGEQQLYTYNYADESNVRYLIFEAPCKCTWKQFSSFEYSARIALGYILGKFSSDEGYAFVYGEPGMAEPTGFRYSETRSSISSLFQPMVSHPYWVKDSALREKYAGDLRELTAIEFSRLCVVVYNSPDFLAALLLIIESSKSSLVMMPACMSVALEAFTSIFVNDHPEQFKPIPDKNMATAIKADLKKVISGYAGLSEEGGIILNRKIDDINKPTNRSQLTKPFSILGIPLTDEDMEAIDRRNDFLHGRLNLDMQDDAIGAGKKIYYITLRLYTLLAALILKGIGFTGAIINQPKFSEKNFPWEVNEEFFRKI